MCDCDIGKDNKILELTVINDSLQNDVFAKDREIRRLNMDLQQYEQAMTRMRQEMNPEVPKKDAEVMAGMCCTGTECGDLVPVQDIGELLQEETSKYKERIQKMETSLKSSAMKMRAVHKINLTLTEELNTLRRLCVAVDAERRDARLKLDLNDQIVKQLARKLRLTKAKLHQKGTDPSNSKTDFVSGDHSFEQPKSSNASVAICTRQPRARRRDVPPPTDEPEPCLCVATSTPDGTQELPDESEISIISPQPQTLVIIPDDEADEVEEALRALSAECHQQSSELVDIHEQSTLRLDTADSNPSPRDQSGSPKVERSPRDKSENLNSDPTRRTRKQSIDLAPDQNPKIQSETTAERSQSPRKHSPVLRESEIIQPEILIPEESESPRKKYEIAVSKQTQGSKKQKITPVPDVSRIAGEQNKTPVSEETQSPRKQGSNQIEYPITKQSVKQSKIPVPKKNGSPEEQINSPVSKTSQSSTSSSERRNRRKRRDYSEKYMHLEHFPKKSLNTSENARITSKHCQCQCTSKHAEITSKDCQCQCTCKADVRSSLPRTCEKSTTSEPNQRWLIAPEVIKKSLAVLRDTFLGKTEDSANIWFKGVKSSSGNLPSDKTGAGQSDDGCYQKKLEVDNLGITQTEDGSSKITPNAASSLDSNLQRTRKKSVQIQMPETTNECDFCDFSEEFKKEGGVYRSKKQEAQSFKKADSSQESETQFFKDVQIQSARKSSGKKPDGTKMCDCDESKECEVDDDGCHVRIQEVQIPDRSDRSQGAKTLSIDGDPELKLVTLEKQEPREDSGGGSGCDGACGRYYRDKLLATLQILENKDETIRIQGSSLGVAEDRIAELTKRASALRAELDYKARELSKLQQFADSCRVGKTDVSIMAEMQDVEDQKRIVGTLEDNLSIIAELYRECFYETAKQEELIDLLRKSYLDVRLMERDKADKITRLQNVINTQKRSIEQCQDVVIEVESLKSEISSFLNSSNNDSGVWERGSECGDVGEELADILEQLRQLQDLLTGDCTCGCEEENRLLKKRNEALEIELDQVRQRNHELDGALRQILDQQYERQINEKERELQEIHKKLADMEKTRKERGESCETLARQLQQAQVMLNDKSAELAEVQRSCAAHEATIKRLEQALDKSEQHIKEDLRKLTEASQARTELLESKTTISELEQRLQHAVHRCQELETSCRVKERTMSEMRCDLEEAHARGARLCDESRRVTARVRHWMRRQRHLAREQQEKIEMQESMLRELQRCAGARQNIPELTSQSETEPCCSNSTHDYPSETSYPRCSRTHKPTCRSETGTFPRGPTLARCVERESETASCSKCASNRQREGTSEMASCSRAPVPPRRLKRRQQSRDDLECPWSQASSHMFSDARWMQLPRARRAPTSEVLERVELLHDALEDGRRRWGRHHS